MPVPRFFWVALFSAMVLVQTRGTNHLCGAEPLPPEAVKATYLIYFGLYVQWPQAAVPQAPDQFVIGILGEDPFGGHLKKYVGRDLNGRRIVVRHFATMEQYTPCHVLFISHAPAEGRKETAAERLEAAMEVVGKQPVLIVTETASFARRGSVINFEDDRQAKLIRMEINRTAERRAELQVSADLLNLSVVTVVQ